MALKLSSSRHLYSLLSASYSYSRLVEQLEPYFSDNISIKRGKSGGGKIVIDFANDEEIEQFIERLRNK